MKILTIIGARPQFIKAAMLSQAVLEEGKIQECLVHTGQHYDSNMSAIFFDQMKIPKPSYMLNAGGGGHGEMTGKMLLDLERIMISEHPDCVVVYGDTNSTLAGALAGVKLHIPIVHIEAGLRSFNKKMPEEVNRIVTDHISDWLFCPTFDAVQHLKNENVTGKIHHTGDIMYDAALYFAPIAEKQSTILSTLELSSKAFALATVHRAENTDSDQNLFEIMEGLRRISMKIPVVFPIHPRTCKRLDELNLQFSSSNFRLIPPLSFFDMLILERHASVILTDSGGIQKEAYFHKTPCVTLRLETEWTETVKAGWNQLVSPHSDAIENAFDRAHAGTSISVYGDGHCASKIIQKLKEEYV